ncbi:hypothetical protein [Streptomyces antibioticus]|uniref:hypothetical protein n=1 Tax=Streptomyces antibioticus TaxID=1890 RepID=UPI003F4637A7
MKHLLLGALLGLLAAYPPLLSLVLTAVAAIASQPPVIAVAAGILLWPRITRRIKRWAR